MIRVALAGHRGRTGSALVPAMSAAPGIEYVGGVGRGDDLAAFLREARPDVLVDFTHPSVAGDNALAAVAAGAVPVVGTSGLADDTVDRLEAACGLAGLGGIVAPNFAIGAVLMMHLADLAAPFFDAVEVIEMHHAAKADAPSGTALATARRLAASRGTAFAHRQPEKITLPHTRGGVEGGVAVHSVRLPGVVADQEVLFGLAGQTLSIVHRTTGRDCYAPGVLLAVRRLVAEPRFYRGLDVLLGLRRPDGLAETGR
ncbi:MAG TPA: 4-hydroxy-tetrahydrodipicolinate reductase [Candidatus Dormibacteraeota bacterium]|nr:4-hydroxy-tetrahydrodipicolinate reductase [Candidatus Dormibacteraeota bacterium]